MVLLQKSKSKLKCLSRCLNYYLYVPKIKLFLHKHFVKPEGATKKRPATLCYIHTGISSDIYENTYTNK